MGYLELQSAVAASSRQKVKKLDSKFPSTILTSVPTGSRRAHGAVWRQTADRWLLEQGYCVVHQPEK